MTPLIFKLEHWSKAQNVGHVLHGFPENLSTSGDTSYEKVRPSPKISSFWIVLKYSMQLQFDIRYWKVIPNYARKNIFMMMTSSMTSQEDLEIVLLYSLINEKWQLFVITETSSLHLVYVCTIGFWICAYNKLWITSLMTSSELQISQKFGLH